MDSTAEQLNRVDDGHFASEVGIVIDRADKDRVEAHLDIETRHTQPMGIVHGGVYTSIIETLASLGAFLTAWEDGKGAAGVENHTSFIRSIGAGGRVTAVALPIHRGRSMHLWEVDVKDDKDRLVARGTVRLAILDQRDGAAPPKVSQTPAS
ncbi:MAG: PaaI family thioesterase [Candidatus Dormibacteraeota bacterium]|nr:PaaI family thioesterase [Candidatus Dormibacteraeota bacterium]